MNEHSGLDESAEPPHDSKNELAGFHRSLAETSAPGQNQATLEEHTRAGCEEHGLRGRTGEPADAPRDTRPDRATRFIETTLGILSYAELAPHLGKKVLLVQADIERGVFGSLPLDEFLLLEFHRRIAADLVPDWAGRWRTVEVRVGNLVPPQAHTIPQRMRDYSLDLLARWSEASASTGELTLEFLAFAEGRFLTVHPFQDFNGRVIRLFLGELLRRLDLPPVRLEAEEEAERASYFSALESMDAGDIAPLLEIWKQRFAGEPATGWPTNPVTEV